MGAALGCGGKSEKAGGVQQGLRLPACLKGTRGTQSSLRTRMELP